jgi:pyruvate/2-oxoacid:ferredoxin oxidoreductase beta subunit
MIHFKNNYRMKNQSLLVILLVVIVATCHTLPTDNDDKIDEKLNEIERNNDKLYKPDPKVPKALDSRFNKMLPMPKLNENQLETASKAEKAQKSLKPSTTEKAAVKDETSTIGNS